MEFLIEYLPLVMFAVLAILLFSGYPVAFILGGVALLFAVLGDLAGTFRLQQLTLIPLRIYGGTMESLVLVAIPMFTFMGTMLEKIRGPRVTCYTRCKSCCGVCPAVWRCRSR